MAAAEISDDLWPLPPEDIELRDDEAHVWMIRTGGHGHAEGKLLACLSADEQQRAARFKFAKDRQLYVAAHAGLRTLLANYLSIAQERIRFEAGAHGKPVLARPADSGLEFNLSHSHELALVAVAHRRALGIDVEFIKRDFAFHEVARRFFTAKEVAALFELQPSLQSKAFFKCWSSKEAFLKAKSTGLSGKLDEVQIVLTSEGVVKIEANVPGWSLLEVRHAEGYEAALVMQGGALPIHCYRWQPMLGA